MPLDLIDNIYMIKVGNIEYSICLPHADVDYIQKLIATSGQPYELAMLNGMVGRLIYVEALSKEAFLPVERFLAGLGYVEIAAFNASSTHLFIHNSKSSNVEVDQFARFSEQVETDPNTVKIIARLSKEPQLVTQELHDLENRNKELEAIIIPQFKRTIHSHEREFEALRQNLKTAKTKIKKAESVANQAELSKLKAIKQVEELRASIMFQLGYTLVNGVLSFRGFLLLPVNLFKVVINGLGKALATSDKSSFELSPTRRQSKPVVLGSRPQELRSFEATKKMLKQTASALRVACIMDEFTFGSYQPTCDLKPLTPDSWRHELEVFKPELLFIESAWRGKDKLWGSSVGQNSQDIQDIISCCKLRGIPTIFWNKEDPVHFQTFLNTAKQFDHVFTTDIDCVSRYKTALGHDQVYLLPFACQPAIHNPIEKFNRRDRICFAGSYYKKYPQRATDLEGMVATLPEIKPLEIYDRNFGKNHADYMFPPEYQPYIVGSLPFDKIDIAYKGYNYAINLNSIKQSQSMFARRVYELIASNTLTMSNYSKGIRLMFGDLVACSDDPQQLRERLKHYSDNKLDGDKLRLMALRKVLQEHTYQNRLQYIQEKVFNKTCDDGKQAIAVISFAKNIEQARYASQLFVNQSFPNKSLFLFVEDMSSEYMTLSTSNVTVSDYREFAGHTFADLFKDFDFIATFNSTDYYGPNYLTDIVLHSTYIKADAYGKGRWFVFDHKNGFSDKGQVTSYQISNNLSPSRSVVQSTRFKDFKLRDWRKAIAKNLNASYSQFATDSFNYCENGAINVETVSRQVDDLGGVEKGLGVEALQQAAVNSIPLTIDTEEKVIPMEVLGSLFANAKAHKLKLGFRDQCIQLSSALKVGKHRYIYAKNSLALSPLARIDTDSSTKLDLFIDSTPGLSLSFVMIFLDSSEQRIGHEIIDVNQNKSVSVPDGCEHIQLGFRISSQGECQIKAVVLGKRNLLPSCIMPVSNILLISNQYPSYQDLYRNGFVHSRVKTYKEKQMSVDVFRLWVGSNVSYHEFEGVDVTTGGADVLRQKIADGNFDTILVHFLNEDMWQVLKDLPQHVKIKIWVHGAEIQPWWRRACNYDNKEDLDIAKAESEIRVAFWRDVLKPSGKNLYFVFVSRFFADEIMKDLQVDLPLSQFTIIHNPIDTRTFNYLQKPAGQRKKILSIRPYTSANYANDLSVDAVLLLSKKPWFNELEFRFIGDGKLFDETLDPIKHFENVVIEKRFLRQSEIAALHKEYGVFLCPTRLDTQGVSKDEAMSSGLVPISNAVTAIPEFIDENCGILADGENAKQLAEGIEALFNDKSLFLKLSENASLRVRQQTCSQLIVEQELDVIKSRSLMESLTKDLGLNEGFLEFNQEPE